MVEVFNVPQIRRATIRFYNGNGSVRVAVDERRIGENKLEYDAHVPLSWSGPNGEIIAGFPPTGAPVIIQRGHGGEWFILSYIRSDNIFRNLNAGGTSGSSRNIMSEFSAGRILLQTAATKGVRNRLYVDPIDGTNIGSTSKNSQFDPIRDIVSHKYGTEMSFTEAHRVIKGRIERDLSQNELRDTTSSILTSHEYSDTMFDVSMDSSIKPAFVTTSSQVRNLPLVEDHEIVYEFANSNGHNFTNDIQESTLYSDNKTPQKQIGVMRTDSRSDVFNLNLNYPNHLMEIIKGTAVDSLGNILDLNRSVIPIGKEDDFSFNRNKEGNVDAFRRIRALHRKAIAYHFEINARKRSGNDDIFVPPDVLAVSNITGHAPDYGRDRSRFFIDIDKEGQFKINIPSSSETGNVPLLTRYETGSSILFAQGDIADPNLFGRIEVDGEISKQDIFHDDFSNDASIFLTDPAGQGSVPFDRLREDAPIKYGTAFHNILNTCLQFQNRDTGTLINPGSSGSSPTSRSSLNALPPIDTIVTDIIMNSGDNANAGGRSGSINLDGFLSVNIGANTIDRQSLWLDYAGGIVSNIGRDLRGRSYVGNYDGDILIQIGGSTIGNGTDSRFANQNDAYRQGVFDMRVVQGSSQGSNGGQLFVIRIDGDGLKIASYGRVEIVSAQDMVFRANGAIHFDCEEAIMFSTSDNQRRFLRNGKEI